MGFIVAGNWADGFVGAREKVGLKFGDGFTLSDLGDGFALLGGRMVSGVSGVSGHVESGASGVSGHYVSGVSGATGVSGVSGHYVSGVSGISGGYISGISGVSAHLSSGASGVSQPSGSLIESQGSASPPSASPPSASPPSASPPSASPPSASPPSASPPSASPPSPCPPSPTPPHDCCLYGEPPVIEFCHQNSHGDPFSYECDNFEHPWCMGDSGFCYEDMAQTYEHCAACCAAHPDSGGDCWPGCVEAGTAYYYVFDYDTCESEVE